MIDWEFAVKTGVRWARPGPQVSLGEARRTVAELRELAQTVAEPVQEVTGMVSAEEVGRVAVVDRPGWIRANVDGFRVVLEPLVEQMRARQNGSSNGSSSDSDSDWDGTGRGPSGFASAGSLPGSSIFAGVGSRFTGIQAGLILAYLSGRVLGQYELFLPPSEDGTSLGRLTLVAPNIVMVERELGVDTHDFRKWVCLHEETHRLQFTAVPWLRDYVQGQMTKFLLASELDPGALFGRLRSVADAMGDAMRGSGEGGGLIDAVVSPEQREIMDRLTAVMTLVEGHGDFVMDAVGPQVVPSVAQIRERFSARRGSSGRVEQALRRLLGIDMKMKQYAEGSVFVKTVVDEVGMATFNKVWTSPETLPTRAEIANPAEWMARVAGTTSASATFVAPAPAPAAAAVAEASAPATDSEPAASASVPATDSDSASSASSAPEASASPEVASAPEAPASPAAASGSADSAPAPAEPADSASVPDSASAEPAAPDSSESAE
jgi:putative hydrolase